VLVHGDQAVEDQVHHLGLHLPGQQQGIQALERLIEGHADRLPGAETGTQEERE